MTATDIFDTIAPDWEAERYVTPKKKKGYSPRIELPGVGPGRFNFDEPPETGGTPQPRYRFEAEDGGVWYRQLEKDLQGGRWEGAEHARHDWSRYQKLSPADQAATMRAMWGESPVGATLTDLLAKGASFQEVAEAVKGQNTWRQVSAGEPEPNFPREHPGGEAIKMIHIGPGSTEPIKPEPKDVFDQVARKWRPGPDVRPYPTVYPGSFTEASILDLRPHLRRQLRDALPAEMLMRLEKLDEPARKMVYAKMQRAVLSETEVPAEEFIDEHAPFEVQMQALPHLIRATKYVAKPRPVTATRQLRFERRFKSAAQHQAEMRAWRKNRRRFDPEPPPKMSDLVLVEIGPDGKPMGEFAERLHPAVEQLLTDHEADIDDGWTLLLTPSKPDDIARFDQEKAQMPQAGMATRLPEGWRADPRYGRAELVDAQKQGAGIHDPTGLLEDDPTEAQERRARRAKEETERHYKALGKIGFWETMAEKWHPGKELIERVPFLGSVVAGAKVASLHDAIQQFRLNSLSEETRRLYFEELPAEGLRRRQGKPKLMTDEEFTQYLREAEPYQVAAMKLLTHMARLEREAKRGTSLGGRFAAIISELPTFMVEMALTFGLATAGRKAGTKAAAKLAHRWTRKKLVGWAARRQAMRLARKTLLGRGIRAGGGVVAQTAGMMPRWFETYMQRQTPEFEIDRRGRFVITREAEHPLKSMLMAFADTMVEVGTEQAGEAFMAGRAAAMRRLATKYPGAVRTMRKIGKALEEHGAGGLTGAPSRAMRVAGIQSTMDELGEEQLARIIRPLLNLDPETEGKPLADKVLAMIPKGDEFGAEVLAFLLTGAGHSGAAYMGKEARTRRKQRRAVLKGSREFNRAYGKYRQARAAEEAVPALEEMVGQGAENWQQAALEGRVLTESQQAAPEEHFRRRTEAARAAGQEAPLQALPGMAAEVANTAAKQVEEVLGDLVEGKPEANERAVGFWIDNRQEYEELHRRRDEVEDGTPEATAIDAEIWAIEQRLVEMTRVVERPAAGGEVAEPAETPLLERPEEAGAAEPEEAAALEPEVTEPAPEQAPAKEAEAATQPPAPFDRNEPYEDSHSRTIDIEVGETVAIWQPDKGVRKARVIENSDNRGQILVHTGDTVVSNGEEELVSAYVPRWAVRKVRKAAEQVTEPAPEQAPAKEPWEMTKEEFRGWSRDRLLAKTPDHFERHKFDSGRKRVEDEFRLRQTIAHRQHAQSALSEGKPVPRHVLQEYASEDWAQEALAKMEGTYEPEPKPATPRQKFAKRAKAKQTGRTLAGDYGVKIINAYSDEGEAAKEAFHKDAAGYLRALRKELGWEALDEKRGRRKIRTKVHSNKAGIAGAGEILAAWFPSGQDKGIYIIIGAGVTTTQDPETSPSGVHVMVRTTTRADPHKGGQNQWVDWDLSVGEMAERIRELVGVEREPTPAAKPEPKPKPTAEKPAEDEFAGREKRPDGRLMPQVGDEVYQTVRGFGGMPATIFGEVYKARKGKLRVRVTDSAAMIGQAKKGKTYALNDAWTVRGDPEAARRQEAAVAERKAEEERREEEQQEHTEAMRKRARHWAATHVGEGFETLVASKATIRPGDTIYSHWEGGKQYSDYGLVASVSDDLGPTVLWQEDQESGDVLDYDVSRPATEQGFGGEWHVLGGTLGNDLSLFTVQQKVEAKPEKPKTKPAPKPKPSVLDKLSDEKRKKIAAAKARMKQKFSGGQVSMNAPLDPETMVDALTITSGYIEAGVRTFAEYARQMVEDFGEAVIPYLKSFYEGARWQPDMADYRDEMTPPAEVGALTDEQIAQIAQPEAEEAEASPDADLARRVADALARGETLTAASFFAMADEAYGGTRAEGAYGPSEAYDALEAGLNAYLAAQTDPTVDADQAKAQIAQVEAALKRIPRQANRSGEKDLLQQFSTPPHYAYTVAWVANIGENDVVLEPSAGTGSILVHAQNAAAAAVVANEISERRAALLEQLDPDAVFTEDAEQVHNILPDRLNSAPTVVVMNPPFSRAGRRMGTKRVIGTDRKHVDAALELLADGGRLVAVMGAPMQADKPATGFDRWLAGIQKQYTVRANVTVDRGVYGAYGTNFPTRLLVVDKTGPTTQDPVTGHLDNLSAVVDNISEVRDARTAVQEQPAEPVVREAAGEGRPGRAGQRPTGRVGTGEPGPAGVVGGAQAGADRADRGDGGGGPRAGAPAAAGRPTGRPRGGQRGAGRGTGRGRPGQGRRAAAGKPAREPAEGASVPSAGDRIELGELKDARRTVKPAGQITDSVYEDYESAWLDVPGSKPHPASVVESAAMASAQPPKPTYQPRLPRDAVESGALSDIQIEAAVYAGQAHEQMLPVAKGEKPVRRGFMLGDGTGMGKGRAICGIILDNMLQGREKAVWISQTQTLFEDSKEYWEAIGQDPALIFNLTKVNSRTAVGAKRGIMFSTYDTLKSSPRATKDDPTPQTRLDQIVTWLGEDFDGVIVFDESHNMGRATAQRGRRGRVNPSQKALAGVDLQARLPNARVVYASATAATEVSNFAYADRLGLWGRGTAFPTKEGFIAQVASQGLGMMEVVAMHMKTLGVYLARSISFNDGTKKGTVRHERLEHKLTGEQRKIYNKLAEAWQVVLRDINAALAATGGNQSPQARSAAMSAFWGGHQRFFNQIITSMQLPSVIKSMEKDLAAGRSVVIQLVNTFEAATERALSGLRPDQDIEDLDITPRDALMQMVEHSFPTTQFETYVDDNGVERSRPVTDAKGNPVQNAAAVAMRDKLLDDLASISVPSSPIDSIIDHFGVDKVSEVTGRKRRVVRIRESDGTERTTIQKRPASAKVAETDAFMGGKKRILVFSYAGGTGRSYHADLDAENQQQRAHYLLQPGWIADRAIQGLGRSHRSNQAQAPTYFLCTTDLKGQKRFISTIARRLGQLGALTRGQREAGSGGVFAAADNLEGAEARDGLRQLFRDLYGGRVEGITLAEFEDQTGLTLTDENGNLKQQLPPITQFLNRVLAMNIDAQNTVFGAFEQRFEEKVEQAIGHGTLDTGVETLRADKITKVEDQVVYTDESTGATSRYVKLELSRKTQPITWDEMQAGKGLGGVEPLQYVESANFGKVYAVTKASDRTDPTSGRVMQQYRLGGPGGHHFIERGKIDYDYGDRNWKKLDEKQARAMWDKAVAEYPEHVVSEEHIIAGALLPIWDRTVGNARVWRTQTDAGEPVLGRRLDETHGEVTQTLRNLGVMGDTVDIGPAKAMGLVEDGTATIVLDNGWKIKRAVVSGETRIELVGPSFEHNDELQADGVRLERINYTMRYFIPTGGPGADVFGNVTKYRNVVEVRKLGGGDVLYQTADESLPGELSGAADQPIGPVTRATFQKHMEAFAPPEMAEAVAAIADARARAWAQETGRRPEDWYEIAVADVQVGGEPGAGALAQAEAFHGSPHTFERFATDQIGTGEGAQSFGWGLYFTSEEEIARHYARKLAGDGEYPQVLLDGQVQDVPLLSGHDVFGVGPATLALAAVKEHGSVEAGQAALEVSADEAEWMDLGEEYATNIVEALDWLAVNGDHITLREPTESRNLYKVNLWKNRQENLLDWNKPLNQQSEAVQEALRKVGLDVGTIKYPSLKQAERLFRSDRVQADARSDIGIRESLREGWQAVQAGDEAAFRKWFDAHGKLLSPGRHNDITGERAYNELARRLWEGQRDTTGHLWHERQKLASLELLRAGIDGIRYPTGTLSGGDQSGYNYVVFDEDAVEVEEHTLFQSDQGAVEFLADGRAIIHALENPTPFTAIHELWHIFRRDLSRMAQVSESARRDLATVEKWAGVEKHQWTDEADEKFARAGERYVAEGKAPTTALQAAFAKFKKWLKRIYGAITASAIDVRLTPEVRRVFDRLLGADHPAVKLGQRIESATKLAPFRNEQQVLATAAHHAEATGGRVGPWMTAMLREFRLRETPVAEIPDLAGLWRAVKQGEGPAADVPEYVREKMWDTATVDRIWRRRRNKALAAEKLRQAKVAQRASVRKPIKTRIREGVKGPAPEPIPYTPYQLLKHVMRKAQIVSGKSYTDGARGVVADHRELAAYAKRELGELPLSAAARNHILRVVSRARTPKQLTQAVATVDILRDVMQRKEAVRRLRKIIPGNKALGVMRPEFRDRIQALVDAIGIGRPSATRLEQAAARLNKLEATETEQGNPEHEMIKYQIEVARRLLADAKKPDAALLTPDAVHAVADAIEHLIALNEAKNQFIFGRRREQSKAIGHAGAEAVNSGGTFTAEPGKAQKARPLPPLRKFIVIELLKPETKALRMAMGDEGSMVFDLLWTHLFEADRNDKGYVQAASNWLRDEFKKRTGKEIDLETLMAWSTARAGWKGRGRERTTRAETVTVPLPEAVVMHGEDPGERVESIELTKAERAWLLAAFGDRYVLGHLVREEGAPISMWYDLNAAPIKFTMADVRAIRESATAEEVALAEIMREFLNDIQRPALNAASVEEVGHEIARRADHWSIRRNLGQEQRGELSSFGSIGRAVLENLGILKPRTGGRRPIVVEDIFTAYQRVVSQASAYIHKAQSIRNARMLLGNPEFKTAVTNRLGVDTLTDFETILQEFSGLRQRETGVTERMGFRALRRSHKGLLALKISVMANQLLSYGSAAAEMGLGDLSSFWNYRLPGGVRKKLWKSPILRERMMGSGLQVISPMVSGNSPIDAFYTAKVHDVGPVMGRIPGLGWLSEKSMKGVHYFDQIAISNIYQAAEARIKRQRKDLSGDALVEEALRVTEKVVSRTQPVWDTLHQSGLQMRAKRSLWAAFATLFSSQRNQNANILARAIIKGNTLGVLRAFTTVALTQWLGYALIRQLRAWALRGFQPDDDDERNRWAEVGIETARSAAGSFYIVGDFVVTAIDQVAAKLQGRRPWDRRNPLASVVRDTMDILGGAIDAVKYADGDVITRGRYRGELRWRRALIKALRKAFKTSGPIFGLPTQAMEEYYRAALKAVEAEEEQVRGRRRKRRTRRTRRAG